MAESFLAAMQPADISQTRRATSLQVGGRTALTALDRLVFISASDALHAVDRIHSSPSTTSTPT